MSRRAIITAMQSAAVIVVCALVGLSLAKVTGGDREVFVTLALGGALIGAIAVLVGLAAKDWVHEIERRRSPKALLGLRVATVAFIGAVAGWLIAVFVSGELGWLIGFVSSLVGVAGIIYHNVNLVRRVR